MQARCFFNLPQLTRKSRARDAGGGKETKALVLLKAMCSMGMRFSTCLDAGKKTRKYVLLLRTPTIS